MSNSSCFSKIKQKKERYKDNIKLLLEKYKEPKVESENPGINSSKKINNSINLDNYPNNNGYYTKKRKN